MSAAAEALRRLSEGNQRYVAEVRSYSAFPTRTRRSELVEGQTPFAIILGCSDSRVPAEIVFDQGLGDLFVIRVAGNIVAPSQVASVEFAAEQFGTRLVVVLGHTNCGAIAATYDAIDHPKPSKSSTMGSIVDRIRPSIQALLGSSAGLSREELISRAVRANIQASANHLRHGSQVLEELAQKDGLCVVGAEYNLDSGEVDFFDGVEACR